jgi:hypothetical protein
MRRPLHILGLAVIHFIVSRAVFFMLFATGMDRFEAGGSTAQSERVLEAANSTLQFPLVTLVYALPRPLPSWFYGPVEYVPFILNSLLWAAGVYLLATALSKAAGNRGKERPFTAA